jgi:hypothetical protein
VVYFANGQTTGCSGSQGIKMQQPTTIWNGTHQESITLTAAIERNCACQYGSDGAPTATCAPHRMLTDDQRALNGLLFYKQIATRLQREEFLGHDLLGAACL